MAVTSVSLDRIEYINLYYGRFNIKDSGDSSEKTDYSQKSATPGKVKSTDEIDEKDKRRIEQLKKRDAAVRLHEQQHLSAAGTYAKGGAKFEYTTGPDGKRYATGGEVSIDTSKIPDDPEATIKKAQIIRRAALAPADPSAQDRSVASQATQMEMEARQELAESQTQSSGYTREGTKVASMASPSRFNFTV